MSLIFYFDRKGAAAGKQVLRENQTCLRNRKKKRKRKRG